MDELRWLLLGFGVLTVAAVYFYSRRDSVGSTDEDEVLQNDTRLEPTLGPAIDSAAGADSADIHSSDDAADEAFDPIEHAESSGQVEEAGTAAAPAKGAASQKIVTLRIVARDRGSFAGDELILSLRGIGMRHGKFGIFHRFDGDDDSEAIFSAASLVEPGSFDLSNIKQQMIPGISIFAVFPGPVEGVEAFDLMMAAARAIAKTMNADLLDESGSTLSIQRERYLREEIIQFEHSLQVNH